MKRVNNLYNTILDIKKIQDIYDHQIKVNTKNKLKLEKFEYNYVSNMTYIRNVLENRNYKPGKYNIFLIREPKVRLIMSQNIIDKIINHVVSKYFLTDIFDKTLIDTSVATRKGKGTNHARVMLKKYLNEVKSDEFYVLKFDISKYFYNLNHDILKRLVRKKIKDKDVLKIIDDIIDSTDHDYINLEINNLKEKAINKTNDEKLKEEIRRLPLYRKGYGLPIGNLSSQVLAVMYTDELCHYIKEKLHIKYFILYMDDGLIIHKDKEYLKYCLKEIETFLESYELKLNNKTKIYKSSEGFEFLGFRYYIKNNKVIMKVKGQTKRKFKRKMKLLYTKYNDEQITYKELSCVKNSYLGHLNYGNCNNLINSISKFKNWVDVYNVKIIDNELVYEKDEIIY